MSAFEFEFMRRALVATVIVCAVAPVVGTFVVQRRQSLIGDGMGHVAFAGVGLAYLLALQPLVGALALTVLAALALTRLQRSGLGGDLSLALIFYGGIALGFLFLSRSGAGLNQLIGFLFGSPLNLTWMQVGWIAVLAALVLAGALLLYRPLVAIAFDEEAARVSGVRTDALATALTLMVALMVVGGMHAIGLLLVSAMMVVPVAAAARVTSSYRGTLLVAAGVGAFSAVAGLLGAFHGDASPGASIVLTAVGCHVALSLVGIVRTRTRAVAV